MAVIKFGGLGPKRRFSHYSGLKFGGMVRYHHTYKFGGMVRIAIRTCMQKIFSGKHTAKPPNFPAIPYHLVRIMATIDDPLIEVVGDDSRHNDSEQIQKEPRV